MKQNVVTITALVSLSMAGLVWFASRDATGSPPSKSPAVAPTPLAKGNAAPAQAADTRTQDALIERGRHLVLTSACHDCHTPFKMGPNGPAPDMARQLSGHPDSVKLPPPPPPSGPWVMSAAATNTAWSGPWGVSFTANLTPDKETGLGAWTRDTFIQTIRTGKHLGRGRPILPPMPIPVYQNFTDEELGAIFAYLQTVPAIKNRVPEPLPPPAAKPARG